MKVRLFMNEKGFTRKLTSQEKWLYILTVLPLYLIGSSLIGNAILKFIILTFHLNMSIDSLNAYLNLIVDLGMFLFVIGVFKETLLVQWKDFCKKIKYHLLLSFIGIFCLYGAAFIGSLLTFILGGNNLSENQALVEVLTIHHPIIMIFTTVVIAPILEEIIFRCGMFGWLYEMNKYLAHIVSGFVFGFMHIMMALFTGNMFEWIQIFTYFFTGIILSVLYEKSNNIGVPILTHMFNNLVSIIFILLL